MGGCLELNLIRCPPFTFDVFVLVEGVFRGISGLGDLFKRLQRVSSCLIVGVVRGFEVLGDLGFEFCLGRLGLRV